MEGNLKKYLLPGGLAVFAAILIGYGAKQVGYQRGLAQGRLETEAEYKEKLSKSMPGLILDGDDERELDFFSGVVENIEGNILTVKTTIYPLSPLNDPLEKSYRVAVGSETAVVKRVEKTEAEIREESLESEDPPEPTKEVIIDFGEIVQGDRVAVQAGENILDKQTFEAVKIILIY